MNTPETETQTPIDFGVAPAPPEPSEQEKAELLQGLQTTLDNFQIQFPSRSALHKILKLVLQLCREQNSVVFTSTQLVNKFGREVIFYPDKNTELVIKRFFASDFDDHSQSPPVSRIPKNASYVYPGQLASYMVEVIRLIKKADDSDRFPVNFARSPELGKGKKGQPVTFWVVRNKGQ